MDMIQPRLLAVNHLVARKDIFRECLRLSRDLEGLVKKQPLALIKLADGGLLKGDMVGAPLNISFRKSPTTNACAGWQQGWKVRVNVGMQATWADIIEVTLHEISHAFRPYDEVHSQEFWRLLDSAMTEGYGIRVPLTVPAGKEQYWRDWQAQYDFAEKHPWARVRPFQGSSAPIVRHPAPI